MTKLGMEKLVPYNRKGSEKKIVFGDGGVILDRPIIKCFNFFYELNFILINF